MALCIFFAFGVMAVFCSGLQLMSGVALSSALVTFAVIGGVLPLVLLLLAAFHEHRKPQRRQFK